ncbi:hypothetical protein [Acidisphaera sp. L21]|nr:hypothetical protein [Acidisphaera sp. L21]
MRIILIVALLGLPGCSGVYLGDNPRPDVSKQTGPLTTPPSLRPNTTP